MLLFNCYEIIVIREGENESVNPNEVLRERIKDRGIKITHIAKRSNMSANKLGLSLRGKRNLKPMELIAICDVLGLDLADFKGREEV